MLLVMLVVVVAAGIAAMAAASVESNAACRVGGAAARDAAAALACACHELVELASAALNVVASEEVAVFKSAFVAYPERSTVEVARSASISLGVNHAVRQSSPMQSVSVMVVEAF